MMASDDPFADFSSYSINLALKKATRASSVRRSSLEPSHHLRPLELNAIPVSRSILPLSPPPSPPGIDENSNLKPNQNFRSTTTTPKQHNDSVDDVSFHSTIGTKRKRKSGQSKSRIFVRDSDEDLSDNAEAEPTKKKQALKEIEAVDNDCPEIVLETQLDKSVPIEDTVDEHLLELQNALAAFAEPVVKVKTTPPRAFNMKIISANDPNISIPWVDSKIAFKTSKSSKRISPIHAYIHKLPISKNKAKPPSPWNQPTKCNTSKLNRRNSTTKLNLTDNDTRTSGFSQDDLTIEDSTQTQRAIAAAALPVTKTTIMEVGKELQMKKEQEGKHRVPRSTSQYLNIGKAAKLSPVKKPPTSHPMAPPVSKSVPKKNPTLAGQNRRLKASKHFHASSIEAFGSSLPPVDGASQDNLQIDEGPPTQAIIAKPPSKVVKSFLSKYFEKALRRGRRLAKSPNAPLYNATVKNLLAQSMSMIQSFRDRNARFTQMNSTLLGPSTRPTFNRYLRLQLEAHFSEFGNMMLVVKVTDGSVNPDASASPPDQPDQSVTDLSTLFDASMHITNLVTDHRLDCPYHPAFPGPKPVTPAYNSPLPPVSEPKDYFPPPGTRLLLIYHRPPIPKEALKVGETILRVYPNWKVLYHPHGVHLCCQTFQYLLLNGYNILLEQTTPTIAITSTTTT